MYRLIYADMQGNKRENLVTKSEAPTQDNVGQWFYNGKLQLIKIQEV